MYSYLFWERGIAKYKDVFFEDMRIFILLILIGLIVGCATTSKDVTSTGVKSDLEQKTSVVTQVTNNLPTQESIKPREIKLPSHPASQQTNTIAFPKTNKWILLDTVIDGSWSLIYSNNFYPKKCVIIKGNRHLELTEDTQRCKYEGVNIYLGFSPRWENGKCVIYSADFDSTIKPLMESKPVLNGRKPTIVIDPGHGGNDSGAINILNGKPEKDYTLDIGRRVAFLLRTNGWNVIMTRTNDVRVELVARAAFSQNSQVDAFVSIHLNYFDKSVNVQGLETYCLTPNGTASTLTRGYTDNTNTNYVNNEFDFENVTLAAEIHKSLIDNLKAIDRGVRRARFMSVLQNQKCPAVLIEVGYLSSRNEAVLIEQPEYRQKIAVGIADGLKNFYNRGN